MQHTCFWMHADVNRFMSSARKSAIESEQMRCVASIILTDLPALQSVEAATMMDRPADDAAIDRTADEDHTSLDRTACCVLMLFGPPLCCRDGDHSCFCSNNAERMQ